MIFPNVASLQGPDPILSTEMCENAGRVVFFGIWPVLLYMTLSVQAGLIKSCTANLLGHRIGTLFWGLKVELIKSCTDPPHEKKK